MNITFEANDKHISIDLVALDLIVGGDTDEYSKSILKEIENAFWHSVEYYEKRGFTCLAEKQCAYAKAIHEAYKAKFINT